MMLSKFATAAAPLALFLASPTLAEPAARAAAAASAPKPDLDPALWVVKDKDTTIYLFGTIHLLDGKGDWFNDEVKASFDKSDELILEAILPDNPEDSAPLVLKYGVDTSGKSLTSKLTPNGQKLLGATLTKLGMPVNGLDVFKPMFADIIVTVSQYQKLGLGADSGVEKALMAAARASNKKMGELEGMEVQMKMFDALPEAEQVRILEKDLGEFDESPKKLAGMIDAWGKGDADTVGKMFTADEADSAALYKVMLVDRNANWKRWIETRLQQPGTVFVAVGAGHLAGPDSVLAQLANDGVKSKRVPHQK